MKGTAIAKDTNTVGTVFALVRYVDDSFGVYKLCSNYCGQVHGGISKTWRYVAKNLSEADAESLYERKLNGKEK